MAQREDKRRSGPLGPPQAPGRIIESRRGAHVAVAEGDDNALLLIAEVPNLTEEVYAGMADQMMPLMRALRP